MDKIAKISFILSLIGILVLMILTSIISPREILPIKNLNETMLNKQVAVQAEIIQVRNYEGFQILTLRDASGIIKATAFSKTPLNKTNSQEVIVTGKITKYEDDIQIAADKIIKPEEK